MVNTRIFDQVYRLLESNRYDLLMSYYRELGGPVEEEISFRLASDKKSVIRGDEEEDPGRCVVSWDNTNADLRTLARAVMHQLTDEE